SSAVSMPKLANARRPSDANFRIEIRRTGGGELRLERVDGRAGLLRADVLDVETENPGELGEVVDVAAGLDHREHAAAPPRRALLVGEVELPAIGVFVAHEGRAVLGAVEGEAHAVEGKPLLRL